MTYYKAERQIPLMLDANAEMFKAMANDKIKIEDLERVWLDLFKQSELYDAKHIVHCQRMLFESALTVMLEMNRNDFDQRQKEKELSKELSYEDASLYLDCSVSTIKRLVGQNKLATKKYNSKNVRITVAELERFKATPNLENVATVSTGQQN